MTTPPRVNLDANRNTEQARSKSEIALAKFRAKKEAEATKSNQQKLKEEIDRVQKDTLRMFSELAQMPDISGKGDNIQQMTNMTLAVQQMEMSKLQTDQTGELIENNGITQLLVAAGYTGRQAEVMDNTLIVTKGVDPKVLYEINSDEVSSVRIWLRNKQGKTYSCVGLGGKGKWDHSLGALHLPEDQYRVQVVPMDKAGKPIYSNYEKRELMKIPTFTRTPIQGWERDNGKLFFSNGVALHPVDKLKQIYTPAQPTVPMPGVTDYAAGIQAERERGNARRAIAAF